MVVGFFPWDSRKAEEPFSEEATDSEVGAVVADGNSPKWWWFSKQGNPTQNPRNNSITQV